MSLVCDVVLEREHEGGPLVVRSVAGPNQNPSVITDPAQRDTSPISKYVSDTVSV
jgi:hypothetical protein